MADSENSVAQTILYLRPQKEVTIETLDIPGNEPYVRAVTPPPDPVDIPLGETPNLCSTAHDHQSISQSTPGLYPNSRRVFRLGFNSTRRPKNPSPRGFEFGFGPDSDVKGALQITSLDEIKVGTARLREQQSLLLIAGTIIQCGGQFEFTVEFPDLSNCAEEHERNYQQYATALGPSDAQYLPSYREEYPPIGAEHRSVAILGKGSFGEVHKALKMKDRSSVGEGQIPPDYPQETQLTIQLGEDGRLSLTVCGHNDALMLDSLVARDEIIPPAVLANNAGPQGTSSSIQDVARRLLAALQAEGYGNYVVIEGKNTDVGVFRNELSRLSISSIQVRQESESSFMLGIEFDNAPRRPYLQALFSQVRPAFLDEPGANWQEPVGTLDQFSIPTIKPTDGAITSKVLSVSQQSVTSTGSDAGWSGEASKGVTYPSSLDDVMEGISF